MLSLDPRAEALLAPVQEALQQALGGLHALDASLRVEMAELPGTHRVELGRVLLDERLLAGVSHPCEPSSPLPPLDRWRRAAGAVLEGVATQRLAARWGVTPDGSWPWVGVAIHLADRAAPVLGLAEPDLAVAIGSGVPGEHPRAGVAVARGWEAMGRDPVDEAGRIVAGGPMDPDDWVEIGEWVLGAPWRAGSAAGAGCPSGRGRHPVDASAVVVGATAGAGPPSWRAREGRWPGRGGRALGCRGAGAAHTGRRDARTLSVRAAFRRAAGHMGRRERRGLRAGDGGAGGDLPCFTPTAGLEIVMADAFVGSAGRCSRWPSRVGTSGICRRAGGEWRGNQPACGCPRRRHLAASRCTGASSSS